MGYLTITLAKGRLANKTTEMFEAIGISCDEMKDKTSRKLIFANEDLGVHFFLTEANDVPTYVKHGATDINAVGRDIILKEERKFYEVMDPGVGKCRIYVCELESARGRLEHHELIRMATRYPNIAKDYFYNQKYRTVKIIKLNGSVELAPIVGLSEVIVDVVETGSTLRESGLIVLEEVCGLSARMVVNQMNMKTENKRIMAIIREFQLYLKKNAGKQDDRNRSGKRRNVKHENRDIKQ